MSTHRDLDSTETIRGRSKDAKMIHLTRLNHEPIVVNVSAIQYIESKPDTVIVFNNGDRLLVTESVEELVARAVDYQRRAIAGAIPVGDVGDGNGENRLEE